MDEYKVFTAVTDLLGVRSAKNGFNFKMRGVCDTVFSVFLNFFQLFVKND